MGVCEPLMPDVVSPKVHQNNRKYVSSADQPLDSQHKNSAWWMVTRKTVKIGGGHLVRYGRLCRHGHLPGTIHNKRDKTVFSSAGLYGGR